MLSISPTAAEIVSATPVAVTPSRSRGPAAPVGRVGLGVEAILATPTFSDLADSERGFLIEARREVQRRAKAAEKSAKRREADTLAIQDIANAIIEIADDLDAIGGCDRAQVAAYSLQSPKTVNRLWWDAVWLARDAVARDAGVVLTPERELQIAYDAVGRGRSRRLRSTTPRSGAPTTSWSAVPARVDQGERPYSNRQKRLVSQDSRRVEYARKIANEPFLRRLTQSAWDRVNIGYHWERAGRVGGATQADGQGKYLNLPFVEAGFRSNTAKGAILKRVAAATHKVGTRRRGISKQETIQRILYLDGIGKNYVEIAEDVKETVSRVRAVVWNSVNDNVLRTGLTNDNRYAHLYKRVALDMIHGNLRTDCKDVFRAVDLDRDFDDVDDLIRFINRRRVRPQKVVWVRDDENPDMVPHPQFVFMLPEKKGVWYGERTGTAMLEAAAAAICDDYGGDPGGLANIFDTKLGTSPHTEFICPETEHLPTLSELCRIYNVDLRNDLTRAARQQTVKRLVDAGVDKTTSMALYTLFWKRAWETADLWELTGDLVIGAGLDRHLFLDQLVEALSEDRFVVAELDKLNERQRAGAEKALRSAARSVSEKYGRNRRLVSGRGYDIGAAEEQTKRAVAAALLKTEGVDPDEIKRATIRAAQQAGQEYARRQRKQKTIRQISDHIGIAVDAGHEPTSQEVAESVGMDPRTVEGHWDAAVTLLAANRIVAAVIRPQESPFETPVEPTQETTATTSAISSSVWGVTAKGQPEEVQATVKTATRPASGIAMRIENLLPAPLMRLVNRLKPWNPASGKPPLGRNMLEFSRPGFTVYRSACGFRQRKARGLVGRVPVNVRKAIDPCGAGKGKRCRRPH
jgi:hypothetical protein